MMLFSALPPLIGNMSPLFWLGVLHFSLGGLFIGCIEGLLVCWLYKTNRKKAMPLIILGNYVSAPLAYYGAKGAVEWWGPQFLGQPDLSNVWVYLWVPFIPAFLITLLVEVPFFAAPIRKLRRSWLTAFKALVIANVVSAVLLVPSYIYVSGMGFHRELEIVPLEEITFERPGATLYYISLEDSGVYRQPLAGGERELVRKLPSSDGRARLFARRNSSTTKWDLWIKGFPRTGKMTELQENFADHAITTRPRSPNLLNPDDVQEPNTATNFGKPTDYRDDPGLKDWRYQVGFSPYEGIGMRRELPLETLRLNLATPFLAWRVRNATVLEGDEVVLQLGEQIIVVDVEERKAAFITKGVGSLVAY